MTRPRTYDKMDLSGMGTDSARPPAGCIVFERTTNFLEPKTDQDKIGFGASVLTFGCDSSQASVAQVCVLGVARGRCVFALCVCIVYTVLCTQVATCCPLTPGAPCRCALFATTEKQSEDCIGRRKEFAGVFGRANGRWVRDICQGRQGCLRAGPGVIAGNWAHPPCISRGLEHYHDCVAGQKGSLQVCMLLLRAAYAVLTCHARSSDGAWQPYL